MNSVRSKGPDRLNQQQITEILTPFSSKTFLARLCEQAERYDGKIP